MTYTILVLFALIVGAGLIAYIGDLLGRRLGKARLSVLGLRPRHTAVLVTAITGMLIAFLTLSIIFAANREFRKAFFEYQKINAENRQLQKDNELLQEQQDELHELVEQARSQESRARESLTKAMEDLEKTSKDLATAEEIKKQLDARIREQQAKLNDFARKLASEQQKLRVAEVSREEAEETVQKLNRIAQDLNQQTIEISLQAEAGRAGYEALRQTPVIYAEGEEVFRGLVESDARASVVVDRVISVLESASREAQSRGASLGSNNRAVVIGDAIITEAGGRRKLRVREAESIEAITAQIRDGRVPVVMQVLARGNSIEGEPTTVQVKLFRNRLVLGRDELLACGFIDGSASNEAISSQIRQFLATEVRAAAAGAGVLPKIKKRDDLTFFEFDLDRLAALVATASQSGGRMRICARSATECYTFGPLQLLVTLESL